MEQRIKGTTGLLALIGSPVGHSGSPDMYNFCFRYHNLDYSYMVQNERVQCNYAM